METLEPFQGQMGIAEPAYMFVRVIRKANMRLCLHTPAEIPLFSLPPNRRGLFLQETAEVWTSGSEQCRADKKIAR
jgi:hypothetical protein